MSALILKRRVNTGAGPHVNTKNIIYGMSSSRKMMRDSFLSLDLNVRVMLECRCLALKVGRAL